VTQRALSIAAHSARRARLYAGLSGWARTGLVAVQGVRAALWLTVVPYDNGGRRTIQSSVMRVVAYLWLGSPSHPGPPSPRCASGAAAEAAGRHFLTACPARVARRSAVHRKFVALVAMALRRTPHRHF